jgi:Phosphotransferase enzyme family
MSAASVPDPRSFPLAGDLAELTQRLPAAVVRATETTGLPSPLRRSRSARIDLADGTSWKGRIVPTAARASTIQRLLQLAGPGFAAPEHTLGNALLSRWIEGQTLSDPAQLSDEDLEHCGTQLGELHLAPIQDIDLPTRSEDLALPLREGLEHLSRVELIDSRRAEQVLAVSRERPEQPETGIIHHDFCGENLIRTQQGSIVCIDNVAISIGALDLDLARTWYRWDLPEVQLMRFLHGYGRLRSPGRFLAFAGYWCVFVLVCSAALRHRYQTGKVEQPLQRLHRLLDRFQRGDRETALLRDEGDGK